MNEVLHALRAFWPLLLLQAALMITGLVDLGRRHEVRYLPKPIWALIIIFVATLGPIIYFVVGRGDE